MGRRSHGSGDCAVRNGEVRRDDKGKLSGISGPSWCGKERTYGTLSYLAEGEDPHAYSRRMATCNKCSAAMGKVRLKQIADRVEIKPLEMPKTSWGNSYKAFWGVTIDGQPVGYILMHNGWGNPWQLHQLDFTNDGERHVGSCVSETPGRFSIVKPDAVFQPVHTRSKEMLASAALRVRDSGGLPTHDEQEVILEQRRKRRAEEDAQREIDRAEAARLRAERDQRVEERRDTAINGLTEIEQRSDLTNLERAGLQAALDIIQGRPA